MLKTEDLETELETLVYSKDHPSTYFGLTETAAADKLKEYGPNALTEKKSLPWYVVLLLNFTGFFNYLMWGGGILCFVSYGA
jgi:magnesium-transporting ATPase (P-type)